ncbi:MAG: 3'-5' exonuclease, partial [Acidobacteriota bacterium]
LRFRAEDTAEESRVAPELQPILEALVMLRRLHLRRNRRPIVETVRELLAATRAHAGFALYPAGNQVLANVQRICDLARGFEMRGGLSFRGFVEQLTAEAERPGSGHAPVLEEGADGVRMMTVHAAKGLEFPVVVLADPTCRLHTEQPGQHVDPERSLAAIRLLGLTPHELRENAERESERDRAEAVRLAYVAATRARDLLVVPAVGDEPYANGWLEPLYPALYPSKETWREPIERRPEFGSSSVLQRPQSFDGEADFSVHPGTHESTAGNRVLWWDPAVLKPVERGPQGVEGVDLLREDGAAAEQGIRKYRRWKDRHRLVIEEGSKPSFAVAAVSTTDREAPDAWALDVQVEALDKAPGRPSGKRFGTLVHTVLRDVPLDGDESTTRDLLVMHGKPLAATIDDIEAAADAVVATLAHPLMRRAARAERLHREAPFILPLDDGTLIEGVIDLVFRDGDGWVVIDFKTDANVEGLVDSYRQQVAWYVTAIKAQTDEPVRGVLLSI